MRKWITKVPEPCRLPVTTEAVRVVSTYCAGIPTAEAGEALARWLTTQEPFFRAEVTNGMVLDACEKVIKLIVKDNRTLMVDADNGLTLGAVDNTISQWYFGPDGIPRSMTIPVPSIASEDWFNVSAARRNRNKRAALDNQYLEKVDGAVKRFGSVAPTVGECCRMAHVSLDTMAV